MKRFCLFFFCLQALPFSLPAVHAQSSAPAQSDAARADDWA
jgi:hypothetical protein